MKRKYPKTTGMAAIFKKNRPQQEIDRKVFREIRRRERRGEKVTYIIGALSNPNNEHWCADMIGKNAECWARTYRRYKARSVKKRTTVKSHHNPINIG